MKDYGVLSNFTTTVPMANEHPSSMDDGQPSSSPAAAAATAAIVASLLDRTWKAAQEHSMTFVVLAYAGTLIAGVSVYTIALGCLLSPPISGEASPNGRTDNGRLLGQQQRSDKMSKRALEVRTRACRDKLEELEAKAAGGVAVPDLPEWQARYTELQAAARPQTCVERVLELGGSCVRQIRTALASMTVQEGVVCARSAVMNAAPPRCHPTLTRSQSIPS